MAIAKTAMFKKYKEKIVALPENYKDSHLLSDEFLLKIDEARSLEIYYAPFEYINENALILILGITPGMHQMRKSYETILKTSGDQLSDELLLKEVRKQSSFEGTMRKNLVLMLDELGLAAHLGITSSIELFGNESHLVQTSSLLPYPVFYRGRNYNGSLPSMLSTPSLNHYLVHSFATEHRIIRSPLVIPLGTSVTRAVEFLHKEGMFNPANIIHGFPHPSGGNGHRHRQFKENKAKMAEQLSRFFSLINPKF